jgi:hypothetical protein
MPHITPRLFGLLYFRTMALNTPEGIRIAEVASAWMRPYCISQNNIFYPFPC